MSFYRSCSSLPRRFGLVLASLLQADALPFRELLPEEKIQQAFDEHGAAFGQADDAVYTPALTLWAFLSQVLFQGEQRSCAAAVARVIVLLIGLGENRPSDNTGAYCRARAKLHEGALAQLTCDMAAASERELPEHWLWKKRHVYLADGSTFSMPDTLDNQAEYPQSGTQKKGVGFPIARMVALISLASAMVAGLAVGPYLGKETGETALFRQLLEHLKAGDVLLADRYYCSYLMVALLAEGGVQVVFRMHQQRSVDFRRGKRLGAGDHVVTWMRPVKPDWMDRDTYDRLPETLTMREVQVQVDQPGCRTKSLVVVTTLLDAETYTKGDLAELYHRRWLVEIDIRAIKCNLGMDVLRSKTPAMVRKEMWTCLLAYNLIRQSLLQAASRARLSPRQLSFTAALQKLAAAWAVLPLVDRATAASLIAAQLEQLGAHGVGDRPGRVEPRLVKRRPKQHKLLNQPRDQARAALLRGKN